MTQLFLDLIKVEQLNDFQKQMILDVADKNYQKVYDNLAQTAKIIGKNEIWESVLFSAALKTQNSMLVGRIPPDYAMSHLWEKVITIMNMKRDGVSIEEQKQEMTR